MLRLTRWNKRLIPHFDALISSKTHIEGKVVFSGGLHIDGHVQGSVLARQESVSVIRLGVSAQVDGDVAASHVLINGRVNGNVYASELLKLASNAVVDGDVHYRLIKMSVGARVTGKLIAEPESGGIPSSVKPAADSQAGLAE